MIGSSRAQLSFSPSKWLISKCFSCSISDGNHVFKRSCSYLKTTQKHLRFLAIFCELRKVGPGRRNPSHHRLCAWPVACLVLNSSWESAAGFEKRIFVKITRAFLRRRTTKWSGTRCAEWPTTGPVEPARSRSRCSPSCIFAWSARCWTWNPNSSSCWWRSAEALRWTARIGSRGTRAAVSSLWIDRAPRTPRPPAEVSCSS